MPCVLNLRCRLKPALPGIEASFTCWLDSVSIDVFRNTASGDARATRHSQSSRKLIRSRDPVFCHYGIAG